MNESGFKGIYVAQDVNYASPQSIKYVEELKENIMDLVGVSEEECDFNELLYICNAQFRKKSDIPNMIFKAFLFTINDFPNADKPEVAQTALEYAKVCLLATCVKRDKIRCLSVGFLKR